MFSRRLVRSYPGLTGRVNENVEPTPTALGAVVRLDHLFDDGQADPGATGGAGARAVDAIETPMLPPTSVWATGQGIPSEHLPKVFERW
jgi:hypothetical protein